MHITSFPLYIRPITALSSSISCGHLFQGQQQPFLLGLLQLYTPRQQPYLLRLLQLFTPGPATAFSMGLLQLFTPGPATAFPTESVYSRYWHSILKGHWNIPLLQGP
jgi:hypothetical protein